MTRMMRLKDEAAYADYLARNTRFQTGPAAHSPGRITPCATAAGSGPNPHHALEVDSMEQSIQTIETVVAQEMARPKFGNVKTNGYASKREAKRAADLRLLERAGTITQLKFQPRFLLIPKQGAERAVYYVADFSYWDGGEFIVEDAKGFKTDVYVLKRKLMLFVHKIQVRET